MKTRPELEAEAMRLIAAVNDNIVLDAKEVLVRALDQMWVEGARWASGIASSSSVASSNPREIRAAANASIAILQALENRENI